MVWIIHPLSLWASSWKSFYCSPLFRIFFPSILCLFILFSEFTPYKFIAAIWVCGWTTRVSLIYKAESTWSLAQLSISLSLSVFLSIYLCLCRTSIKQSWIRRRCISATSTSCMTCTWKHRTTQVMARVGGRVMLYSGTWSECWKEKRNDGSLVGVLSWLCVLFVCLEASYTLLLYDELLEWSDRPLREFLSYPMQSEWQRKEYLHLTIIQNFDRGKVLTLLPNIQVFIF